MLAYLVRHCESLTNAGTSTSLNAPLSPLGRRQAEVLVRRLAGVKFTAIYSSPFRRCLETAEPVAAGRSIPVRIRPELHECYHLPPGGQVDPELEALSKITSTRPGVAVCEDWQGPVVWPAVDESNSDLYARMRSFAEYLKRRWGATDEAVLVVSHGSPLSRLIDSWLTDVHGPSYRYVIDNATVCVLRYKDGLSTLVCLNERSHLIDLPAPDVANFDAAGVIKPLMPPLR